MHKDRYGIIGQVQPDSSIEGGDSACWHGHYVYLTADNSIDYVSTFEVEPGAYVRHPDPKQSINGFAAYYAHPWDGVMSRDQLTGVLCALSRVDRKAARRALWHFAKRGFLFSYNTRKNGRNPYETAWKIPDLLGPSMLALYLRACRFGFWVTPLLWIGDLHLLLDTLRDRIFKPKSDDVINHLGRLFVSLELQSTFLSRLAGRLAHWDYYLGKLQEYWNGWRSLPEMHQLFAKQILAVKLKFKNFND